MSLNADHIGYATSLEPADAVRFLQAKGAQVSGGWTEMLDGQHARAFTVANVTKLDVLQDIQASLAKALKEGQTIQQWKDGLIPELQRKGWWQREGSTAELQAAGRVDAQGVIAKGLTPHRLKTIFQTNMQSAYMAGRYEQMIEQAEERPYWQYVAILDAKTRPAHRALNGKVFRYDDAAWGAFYPPNGFNCRCRVRNFTRVEIERRQIPVSSTEGKLRQVQVPLKNGETATVTRLVDRALPGGKFQPDPGFSNNPGLTAWQPKLEMADVQLSRRYIDTAMQGPAFEQFVSGKTQGAFPVAVLRAAERQALGTEAQVAYLSSETLAKQLQRHPEIGLEDYRKIATIVDDGDVYQQAGNRLIYLQEEGYVYRLALKVAKDGRELFVLSLFRTTKAAARKEVEGRLKKLR